MYRRRAASNWHSVAVIASPQAYRFDACLPGRYVDAQVEDSGANA